MQIRLLATLFLIVALAVVIARQSPKRANAWGGLLAGMLMIAGAALKHSGGISEILLLQADARGSRDWEAEFFLMLGYGFLIGSIVAMPWLPASSAREVAAVLRGDRSSPSSWRRTLVRDLPWLLIIAVTLLLWRWTGGNRDQQPQHAAPNAVPTPRAHTDSVATRNCYFESFCVSVSRTKSTLDFNYESLTQRPFTAALTSSQHGLGGINHSIQFKTSTQPHTQTLFSYQIPAHGHWDYTWHIAIHPGEQTAQHDPTTVYSLPFRSGHWVYVVQTYDDPRSHLGSQRFAIDFGVPIGTEVLAARDGIVIGANGSSNESSRDGFKHALPNYVWVQHRDGTVGFYLHLRQAGVAVAVGQKVQTGQLLGYSGCTGQCNGPHLHFHVSTPLQARDDPKFEAYRTFPTVFRTNNGVELLDSGRSYRVP